MSLTTNPDLLDSQLQKFYNRYLKDLCEDRRNQVVDSSNLETDRFEPNGIHFPAMSLNEKILLGILQWYMPRELGCLVNLYLESHWGGEFKEIRAVLCNSKYTALGYILESDRWSTRDFYGNILVEERLKNLKKIRLRKRKTSRPKQKVWRRGYNDQGSMRPQHKSIGFDYRKLKTVEQQLEEEALLEQKVSDLFLQIAQRYEFECIKETINFF